MIAALPMYLRPANTAAHNRFWQGVRDALRAQGMMAPDGLSDATDPRKAWADPDLVLSHICSFPYRTDFKGKVTLIGASDYGLPDCPPGHFRSLIVVRRDHPARSASDLDQATLAFNGRDSQSGWAAPLFWADRHGIGFQPSLETGSHHASLLAVARGAADVAAIDAVSFAFFERDTPETADVRVFAATPPTPGITFITRAGEDPGPYRTAIRTALEGLDAATRETLMLRDVVALPESAYDLPIPDHPVAPSNVTQG